MKLLPRIVVLIALLRAAVAHGGEEAFDNLKKWLVAQGAEVNQALSGKRFPHGGADIRGVGTTSDLPGDYKTTLFSVPKKLWLLLVNFPAFDKAVLPVTPACEGLATWEKYRMKLSAAIVTEARKGEKSFHYFHIHHLPTMEEFHSFLPNLMEAPLQKDFASLPLVHTAQEIQKFDADYIQTCFGQWQKMPSSLAASLTWDEMFLAHTWIRTRCYGTEDGTAIVPGTDMLNAAKPNDLNTYWSSTHEAFSLHTKIDDVRAGQELYESYCQDCDNSGLLKIWGVYMEDNPNPVDKTTMDCGAEKHGALQKAMEAVLDPKSASAALRSPRCQASVFSAPQGPLRCSLARLTWEYCADSWGLASASNSTSSTPKASFLSRRARRTLTPREEAALISQSSIGSVPEMLRSRFRRQL